MRKIRIVLNALVLSLFVVMFASCGGEEAGPPDTGANEEVAAAAEEFLGAFGEGDAEGSFAALTESAREKVGGIENWAMLIENAATDETLPANWNFDAVHMGEGVAQITGTVETKGEKSLSLTLKQGEDGWYVDGFGFE